MCRGCALFKVTSHKFQTGMASVCKHSTPINLVCPWEASSLRFLIRVGTPQNRTETESGDQSGILSDVLYAGFAIEVRSTHTVVYRQ